MITKVDINKLDPKTELTDNFVFGRFNEKKDNPKWCIVDKKGLTFRFFDWIEYFSAFDVLLVRIKIDEIYYSNLYDLRKGELLPIWAKDIKCFQNKNKIDVLIAKFETYWFGLDLHNGLHNFYCFDRNSLKYPESTSKEFGNLELFRTLNGNIFSISNNQINSIPLCSIYQDIAPESYHGEIDSIYFDNEGLGYTKNREELVMLPYNTINKTEITITNGVRIIHESVFEHTKFNIIKLPNTLEIIKDFCFKNSAINYIIIPDSVKEIGYEAISNCYHLKFVVLSAQIDLITTFLNGSFQVEYIISKNKNIRIDYFRFDKDINSVNLVKLDFNSLIEF